MADSGSEAEAQSQNVQTVADVSVFANYLRRAIPVMLEDGDDTPKALHDALKEKNKLEAIRKFLSDSQVPALLIQRCSNKDEVGGEGEGDVEEVITYDIASDVHFTSARMASVVIIKRGTIIEADKSIASQIRLMSLSDGSAYETLHSFVANAVAPFFKSFVKESGKGERDGDKMAPSVEKKLAELEMGLLHLQQNIDIPEITLTVHPTVGSVIKKAADERRKPSVNDFGDKIEDAQFLNALQGGVGRWIREIQKVTKLDRDPASGTALQEITFWLNLERALLRIQEKRESPEIALTLDVLKHGKRFIATVGFDTDTGLKQALDTVNDYNPLMKDFPLNDLLSATELDRIRAALQAIFTHLRKIRNTKYPIQRALRLVEAISRDLSTQLLKVLGTRRLMHIPFDEFEKVMGACFEVFSTWDDEYDKLQGLLRDIVKKKREEHLKMVWRVNPAHKRLQARLDQMRKFRRQHEQLRQVIVRVLRPTTTKRAGTPTSDEVDNKITDMPALDAADANAIEEVNLAYENVKEVDGLDVSKEGTDSWEAAIKRYDERIDRVETRITARLRDQLGTAKNANEMFRIFSRFNALFVRPHIRGAIREYQTQLIQRVKDDIESLHEKFKVQYVQSKACRMSRVRDLPPVSGSIIWARQIERQLNAYMRRVEDVLGKGWEQHVEGQKLKADGDSFKMKLNTQDVFDDWARKVAERNLGVSGRIFAIESTRSKSGKGNILKLKVNFHPEIITLSKEVRNLKWLGFRVPLAIVNKAHQANQLYPYAISLIESVRSYERTCEKVEEKSSISLLVAGMRKEVQTLISEGINLVWESYKLDPYVQRLAENVFNFQEKVDDLLASIELIDIEIRSLEMCAYNANTFSDILGKIQKAVDDLSLHNYSNLPQWVNKLDQMVEQVLAARLQAGLHAWRDALEGKVDQEMDLSMDTDAPTQVTNKPGGDPQIKPIVHELRITNQLMYLVPPIEEARSHIMHEMFEWEAVITSQNRIQHSRYQVGLDVSSEGETTYRSLLTKLPEGSGVLEKTYESIDTIFKEAMEYVGVWLRYQALWDLQGDALYNRLGDNLKVWMSTLENIKASRKTFDTSETKQIIGPITVEYGKVQSKVSLKYDSWHKEVLSKFGSLLGDQMSEFHGTVSKSRTDLEEQSLDTSTTADAVQLITYVQSLKRKMKNWEKQVGVYKEGQRLLERQRFQFPSTWLYSDNIDGEWGAFNDILKRKDSSIQTQVASLQMKIVSEDKLVENKTIELLSEWEKEKPIEGSLKPDVATNSLAIFEGKIMRLKEERDNVTKAKEALELAEPGVLSPTEDRMQVALEELHDLKGVWAELSKIWEQVDDMKEKPWMSVQPRKFYFVGDEDLLEIIGNSKNIPRLQKHFKKMFAGVSAILLNEDNTVVLGVSSKEGEEVIFHTPVSVADHPKINEWLTLVEKEIRLTLAILLAQAVQGVAAFKTESINAQQYLEWIDKYQGQLVVLASQINWSENVEAALQQISSSGKTGDLKPMENVLLTVQSTLNVLADSVLHEQPPVRRKKMEQLITELVHQRDITRMLVENKVTNPKAFDWLMQMRFYFDPKNPDPLQQLSIQMANAKFNYGFEYLGVQEKLVQTPLSDRCYLTMTQALEARLGGSPFGPAGTGKTETVKALGNQLGRFVLVFNCDENFDFQAMGRIFVGLCQVGAWGCFDEFNRLEERMLSAVSQQIQSIQEALKQLADQEKKGNTVTVEIIGKTVKVNPDMAIFITMNPGYAGRSNLPDNLKKLFRSLAMTKPDRPLIAQVMLYSQGFRMAEKLSAKIVPFFKLCDEQLSPQSHYDFGLRALKSVLVSAGNVKREHIMRVKEQMVARGEQVDEASIAEKLPEQEILIQSVMETVVPKLVAEDIPLLNSLLSDMFPGIQYTAAEMSALKQEIRKVCQDMYLSCNEEQGGTWLEKVLQLYQISQIHHGLMMVGPSGSGKSTAWRVLLKALERLEGVEGVAHVIDPKSISKEALYGTLDINTREWTDGLFTHILRKIIDNVRGEINKRQWIVFDGDVDPEWVENLNSVLDDSKLLTLPNGERLAIPPNVRIMFEVQDLKYATLATVSRCGMVWFSEDVLSTEMIIDNYMKKLRNVPVEEGEEEKPTAKHGAEASEDDLSPTIQTQRDVAAILMPYFASDGLVIRCLEYAFSLEHVMDFTRLRALGSLFSMLNQATRNVLTYNHNHSDFPMQ
ncbi:cytoplasmic dynein 1 heavy chain 1-like, partial [Lingula anatina]|uniref:Cytoplasmic dynein 1 heavy chain 1-like n=1 Tax=Lingula anatina TaxID=7574 RepID=A0A2R2MP41_LINAN